MAAQQPVPVAVAAKEGDLDVALAAATKEELSESAWRELLLLTLRRGRTRDADLAPFIPHLATAPDGELDLGGCVEITDAFLRQAVAAWPAVRALRLDHCRRIGEDGIRAVVSGLPHLESLSIRFAPIPEKALLHLATATFSLKSLFLSGSNGVTENVLLKVLGKFGQLEQLELSHMKSGVVTTNVVRHIAHSLPALTTLSLSWAGDYGDAVAKLPKHCRKLVSVGLADSKTTEASLIKLLVANPALTALDVSGYTTLLQTGCEKLAKQLGGVKSLTVGGAALSDQTLARLVAGAAGSLEELDISGSHKLTPEGLRAALEPAKVLRVLVVGTCKLINEKAVVAIKEAIPALHIYYVPTKP